ncbi:MAG: sialate O-acetylesterase [Verrucomicrobia bacterium]|nr:MAG: sialate O-acetylesterase [Verrucomicrobiota bacterium]
MKTYRPACRRHEYRHILLGLFIAGALPATADVRLPKIFTDNMLLQRDVAVRVWGWADGGEAVSAAMKGTTVATKADEKGQWALELPAIKSGENLELTVQGNNTVTLKNLVVGDIWVCSGQSNMAMALKPCLGAAEDIQAAEMPNIRHLKIRNVKSGQPESDAQTATQWQVCTPATAPGFTAVGFYFAREIWQKTGVPIGIIDTNWGGTRIEPWTAGEEPATPDAKSDTNGLYNAMIHPLVKLPIKGALWYQGEANGGEGETYYDKMRALIGGWRKQWGQGDFPFYYVQLANFQAPSADPAGGNGWAKLREAQTKALSIPNTGMAVIIDSVPLAQSGNIHPVNKYDVGLRLARWALARDYGQKKLEASGPLFKALMIEGDKARVAFNHAGAGLMLGKKEGRGAVLETKGDKLTRIAIAGADRKWFWAEAVIDHDMLVVSSPEVKQPVAVRYAFEMNPDGANLYNREGLPAGPFRSDAW